MNEFDMTVKIITELFDKKPRHASRAIQASADLNAVVSACAGVTITEKAYNYCHKRDTVVSCPGCGKPVEFMSFARGYQKFCGVVCSARAPGTREAASIASKNPAKAAKAKATMLAKYGVTSGYQLQAVKDKVKQTVLAKYGVDHAFKAETVKQRAQAATLQAYADSSRWPIRLAQIEQAFDVSLQNDRTYQEPGYEYSWKHSCGCIFDSPIKSGGILVCPTCKQQPHSKQEMELAAFLAQHVSIIQHDRTVIEPKELDIYIPTRNIAVEYNGLYWHSEAVQADKHYHLKKTEACAAKGIKLIHVFEDEWLHKRSQVEARLLAALGIFKRRIFARNCVVRKVDTANAMEFLKINHLQGSAGASHKLGLFYKDELVALMTFGKPRFTKSYDWELIRFASCINISVVGGASKLLAAFKREHKGSIISYADRRWSDGKLYETIGFELTHAAPPSYCYTDGNIQLSRFMVQRHKLAELLGSQFDAALSEVQNMQQAGYSRIYDCGTLVYAMKE